VAGSNPVIPRRAQQAAPLHWIAASQAPRNDERERIIMFDSGISVKDLIKDLKSEVDVALEIPDGTYIFWLNSLEQLLYSEVIKEQNKIVITEPPEDIIPIGLIYTPVGESPVRFEDIHAIYADKIQLIKSTAASGVIFPNTYYKLGADIGYNAKVIKKTLVDEIQSVSEMTVVYFARPALKKDTAHGNVSVPYEFIDLVKAKLRGEAYKLCNEDGAAAKWLNDYNVLLESFRQWLELRRAGFGI